MVRGTVFCVGALIVMNTKICKECKKEFNIRGVKRASVAIFCSLKCYNNNKRYVIKEGVKNNMLTSIKEADSEVQYCRGKEGSIRKIVCRCDCGNIITTRLINFLHGITKSCGCLTIKQSEINIGAKTHGLSRHPLYVVWSNMIDRCKNPKCAAYKNYGGRGVKVCDEWVNDFTEFYNWSINNGWKKGLQLDKDKLGGFLYSPNTCCFITRKDNMNAKRNTNYIIFEGEVTTLSFLSDKFKIKYNLIYERLKRGWDLNKSLITPIRTKK
jgi:hypothetical protein